MAQKSLAPGTTCLKILSILGYIRSQGCIVCAYSLSMQNTFQYLDLEQFRPLYLNLQNPRKMKFYVEGVKCSKCIAKIENLKNHNNQVQHLEVDLANQTATVELKSLDSSFSRIADEISQLGFRPIPIQNQEDTAEMWCLDSKKDLIRIGVAGYCTGNIMMLAFATYFGLNGTMKVIFEWLQFALYLPVVTYVAWPFYKGFISGLRKNNLSIDGPMAIASFIGFAVSTANLIRGNGSIYFDSTSAFLFLILSTRYFQKKIRFEFLKYLRPTAFAETLKAKLKDGNQWHWVRSDHLKINDVILVNHGELIPADGFLKSSEAIVDLSVLNGESMPRRAHEGTRINAGSRLLSQSAELKVTASGVNSFLGHLLSSINSPSLSDMDSSQLSNKASQLLLISVLSIAAITLFSGIWLDFETQFEKAFALIVIACPCAMAFGTPLAFSFSMKRAQEKGIIIKSARVFEDLEKVESIFIDKTGTLTEKFWNLTNSSLSEPPQIYKQLILKLESKSQHPIAFALREIWSDIQIPKELNLENAQEIPSLGVTGIINGNTFEFSHFFEGSEKWFGLFENKNLLWRFQLKPILLSGTYDAIQEILTLGYKPFLLSGDAPNVILETAKKVGLCPLTTYSGLTAEMKEALVKKNSNSIMIGDGINDSLALKAAKVGIAVNGGVDLALKSADVLFLKEGITLLPELLRLAHQARKQIRKNLRAALIYNILAGTAALFGLINPFIAALLMPVSSIYILVSTWWGTRK